MASLRWVWVGWGVCCALVLTLWTVGWQNARIALLQSRRLTMEGRVAALSHDLGALPELQRAVVASARGEALQGRLDAVRLEGLRAELKPYAGLFWTHHPEADSLQPPAWCLPLAQLKRNLERDEGFLLRPLPPGMEAGLVAAEQPAPELYSLAGAWLSDGSCLLCPLDTSYVFGRWLEGRVQRLGFGLDARLQGEGERWTVPSLFAGEPRPFPPITIGLDHRTPLTALAMGYGLALLAALSLLGFLAAGLRFAARSLRREREWLRARSEFSAMVSHEVRTPLATLRLHAETLQAGLAVDQGAYLQVIVQQAQRLSELSEHLLELGASERSFQLRSLDLNALVLPLAPGAELEPGLPPALADAAALRQVVENLLSNAAKYGGGEAPLVRTLRDGEQVCVEVCDRGPGIPAELRGRVFEPFARLQPGGPASGFGLGLALVRAWTEGQGGRVTLREREGGGCVFRVSLPRA